ncbi:MAG: GNAT family N-acetyltransferase [Pirellulales bacterium]
MIRYRPFRNTDPPQIVSLWREQQADRSLAQPMSVDLFSTLVLSKPYFDNDGLIVAEADGQVVGFVHAGFGPTPQRNALAPDVGVICMLIVEQSQRRQGIGRELLSRAESYLVNQGARVILAGGLRPCAFTSGSTVAVNCRAYLRPTRPPSRAWPRQDIAPNARRGSTISTCRGFDLSSTDDKCESGEPLE